MSEITYELILKYLTKEKHIFITEKNMITNFVDKFKLLFPNNFYRYGVLIYDDKNNISLWSSLLTLLDENYATSLLKDDILCIAEYKNRWDIIEDLLK